MNKIGIRHEDKSEWERRVPLVPTDVATFIKDNRIDFVVQRSATRAFGEEDYVAAGAQIADALGGCPIIMGVKEIPVSKLEANKTYVYFSHTIKGQPGNMPALKRLMDLKCQLIDYEKIVDEKGRRLVFFGKYAGLAGMIDSLWAFGKRLDHEGIANPFSAIQPAHAYADLAAAKQAIAKAGDVIKRDGLPKTLQPLVCGFAGYGQVSIGAQEVFDVLPFEQIAPADLANLSPSPHACYKVVFKEEHLVKHKATPGRFDLQEYYSTPERYETQFYSFAQHLSLLINCIYWEPRYPRLLSLDQLREMYGGAGAKLRVIGDISCDIDGSIECTVKSTTPSSPVFVYEPSTKRVLDGVEGNGPVVLAVDFLPCELPVDASRFFSTAMSPFVPPLAKADFSRDFASCGLPPELSRATIVYHGQLTEPYAYLQQHIDRLDASDDTRR